MTTNPRVAGWANAAVGFGVVGLLVAAAVALPHHLGGKAWWECDDPSEAQRAVATSRVVASGWWWRRSGSASSGPSWGWPAFRTT